MSESPLRCRYLDQVLQEVVDGDPAVGALRLAAQHGRPLVAERVRLDLLAHFLQYLRGGVGVRETGRKR